MNNITTLIIEAVIAFLLTNLDDFLILLIFCSQLSPQFRRRHILIGQYLGFAIIIVASLPGFLGGLLVPRQWMGLLGILPVMIGCKQLINQEEETREIQNITPNFDPRNIFLSIFSPQTYKVAAVTVANSGDNIGIYIPLFSGYNFHKLILVIFIFFIMKTIWYIAASLLVRQTLIAAIVSRYSQVFMPWFLIGMGLYIIYDRGTLNLIFFN
jgi:cadmium resistance transport/sequestration family protein